MSAFLLIFSSLNAVIIFNTVYILNLIIYVLNLNLNIIQNCLEEIFFIVNLSKF